MKASIPGDILDKVHEQNMKNIIRKVQAGKTISQQEQDTLNRHREGDRRLPSSNPTQPWYEGLTEKQRRFCEVYAANGGNALDAAREAGYSKPHPQGQQNLQKPTIQRALELLRLDTTNNAILTREERQALWTKIALDPTEKTADRLRASELLGKSQADFIDRHEVKDVSDLEHMTDEEIDAELDQLETA